MADAALTATAAPTIPATEGAATGTGGIASLTDDDPGGTTSDYHGDGELGRRDDHERHGGQPEREQLPGEQRAGHTYAEEGTYLVTVSIADAGGSSIDDDAQRQRGRRGAACRRRHRPSRLTDSMATGTVALASLTDDDPGGTTSDYTATVNWGDGTTTSATVGSPSGSSFPVSSAGHTYADEGTYLVTVRHRRRRRQQHDDDAQRQRGRRGAARHGGTDHPGDRGCGRRGR